MRLTVDRMTITLPAGLAPRAGSVARLVADELAGLDARGPQRLQRLSVGPVEIHPAMGDVVVARAIAQAIGSSLDGAR